jgi:hypothetical protein
MNEESMTTQAEALAQPAATETRVPLYRGIALVGIAAFPAASLFSIFEVRSLYAAPLVHVIVSTAGLGLIMGLMSRLVLPRRGAALRWLVALFGLSLSMTFLGWLSRGSQGLNLIGRSATDPNWAGLIRYTCAAAVSWIAIRAWAGDATSMPRIGPINFGRARPGRTRLGGQKTTRTRRRGLRRKRTRLRLAAQVEHRCPYCLEIVEPRDPRGAVECSTCHAFHHADCWAVTGTCQVPHHNG